MQALASHEGSTATLWNLPGVHVDTMGVLVRSGVAQEVPDEFGDIAFALRPGAVDVSMQHGVQLQGLLASEPTLVEPWRSASRIDLVV